MGPTDSADLLQEQAQAFQDQGVVLLRQVFTDWVEPLRRGIETNMANPSWRERTYRPADESAPFFQDFCNWRSIPEYRDFVMRSPAARLAAHLMGSKTARMFHEHVLVKEPGTSVVTPWHQDQPYYIVAAQHCVSFWIPLDPVSRETTSEYIAGSHLWGKTFLPSRFDGTKLYPGDTSEPVPDIEDRREELPVVGWAMEPGDAVAFHFRTLHGAPANASKQRRRVLSTRWVGDDAVFVKRPGPGSPPFPDLSFETGDPFEGTDFPVLYERDSRGGPESG